MNNFYKIKNKYSNIVHPSIEEAIAFYAEYFNVEDTEFPAEVHIYKEDTPFGNLESLAKGLTEDVVEKLDEEYLHEDADDTVISSTLEDAMLEFTKVLQKEYRCTSYVPTGGVIYITRESFINHTESLL